MLLVLVGLIKGRISLAFLVDGLYCVASVCSVRSGGFDIALYVQVIACEENCWRSSSTLQKVEKPLVGGYGHLCLRDLSFGF